MAEITTIPLDAITKLTNPQHGDLLYGMADPTGTKLHRAIEVESIMRRIDVTQWGAVGDGVTDNTAAIQAAIAAAQAAMWSGSSGIYGDYQGTVHSAPTVWFPAGVYLISDSLTADTVASTAGLHFAGNDAILVAADATMDVFGYEYDA